jgi:hypothetical protein
MTEKRQLVDIIEELNEVKKGATQNLDDFPYAVRQSRAIMKEQYKTRLAEVQKEFESTILPHRLVGLFVDGVAEDVKRLSDFIKNKGGIVIDANILYNKLADEIEPSYYVHRTFDTTQYGLMVSKLGDIGTDLGYSVMQHPVYKEATCPTREDTVQHVKMLIRNAIGDDINLYFVKREILETVQREKLRAEQLVVLVYGANPQEKQKISYYFNRFVQFNIPENYQPTNKEVSAVLKNKEENKE